MWYHIRAKDTTIFKPDGKVITFSLWADSEDKLYKILTEKGCKDITILKSTNEEWTPEWVNSTDDLMTPVKLDPDPDDIPKIEKKDNPFW
tara:strand:- start:232 stop:501 length:270 start_codon:yes stop_codon:yes gene_type:complete